MGQKVSLYRDRRQDIEVNKMLERVWVFQRIRIFQRVRIIQGVRIIQRVRIFQRMWACKRVWVCSAVILFLLFGASFIFTSSSDAGGQLRGRARRSPSSTSDDMNKGLQFRLSEGAEQAEHREPVGPVRAEVLPESD